MTGAAVAPPPLEVADAFDALPHGARTRLLWLREFILRTARDTPGVGDIVETLKWGQPSYLTVAPKSGTTIRLGLVGDGRPAMFCHCQTNLIDEFRRRYPADFDFVGNRALVLRAGTPPRGPLGHCIGLALTCHARKRRGFRLGSGRADAAARIAL